MALTDFLCLITENIIAIPVIDANIPQRQIQFILFCFYVITKERLDIEFIAQNCSINQKTHNNMSINVFPLSHQTGTIWRHACSNHICFSAKGASLQSCSPSCFYRAIQNRPITMVHPTTMVAIVMPNAIHRQICSVCFLRSILLLFLKLLIPQFGIRNSA